MWLKGNIIIHYHLIVFGFKTKAIAHKIGWYILYNFFELRFCSSLCYNALKVMCFVIQLKMFTYVPFCYQLEKHQVNHFNFNKQIIFSSVLKRAYGKDLTRGESFSDWLYVILIKMCCYLYCFSLSITAGFLIELTFLSTDVSAELPPAMLV